MDCGVGLAGPSAPFIYNVTIISTSSVLIEWNPPEVYYRRVDRYLLMWSAGGGSTYLDHFVSGSVNQVNGIVVCHSITIPSFCVSLFSCIFPVCMLEFSYKFLLIFQMYD